MSKAYVTDMLQAPDYNINTSSVSADYLIEGKGTYTIVNYYHTEPKTQRWATSIRQLLVHAKFNKPN